jgi:hypothetical protein
MRMISRGSEWHRWEPHIHAPGTRTSLRLDVAAKSGFVNVHLLISPEDPDHLSEVKRIPKRLQFHAFDDRFDCTREELIKLGKRADSTITDDGAALRHGATQFEVNFDQLRKVIGESEWATKNVLIGVRRRRRRHVGRPLGGRRHRPPRDREVRPHYLLEQSGAARILDWTAQHDDGGSAHAIQRVQTMSPRQRLP